MIKLIYKCKTFIFGNPLGVLRFASGCRFYGFNGDAQGAMILVKYYENALLSKILKFWKNLLYSYFCTFKFIRTYIKCILCFIVASFLILACGNFELLMVNFYFYFLTLILPMFQILIIFYYRPNLVIYLLVGRLTVGAYLIFF